MFFCRSMAEQRSTSLRCLVDLHPRLNRSRVGVGKDLWGRIQLYFLPPRGHASRSPIRRPPSRFRNNGAGDSIPTIPIDGSMSKLRKDPIRSLIAIQGVKASGLVFQRRLACPPRIASITHSGLESLISNEKSVMFVENHTQVR